MEKLSQDPFLKTSKLSISLNQQSKILYCLFLSYAKLRTILKLSLLYKSFFIKSFYKAFLIQNFLKKQKEDWN